MTIIIHAQQLSTSFVYFESDKSTLDAKDKIKLNEIINSITTKELATITLQGHTDQDGNNAYNDKLSMDRANAVKAYFVAKGINPQQISIS
ncbi:MAG: OmpA family protein, partial [Bacteroidota bacterium]